MRYKGIIFDFNGVLLWDEAEEALRVASRLGDRLWGIRLDTCGLSRFSYRDGRFVLTGHNDTSFLAPLRRPPPADF